MIETDPIAEEGVRIGRILLASPKKALDLRKLLSGEKYPRIAPILKIVDRIKRQALNFHF